MKASLSSLRLIPALLLAAGVASAETPNSKSHANTLSGTVASVDSTGKALVVYEDNQFGGYGAEVAALIAEEAFEYLHRLVSSLLSSSLRPSARLGVGGRAPIQRARASPRR